MTRRPYPTDIATTAHELVAGHSPVSASIARFIVRRTQATPGPPPGPHLNTAKLTPREIDILWGIAQGFSYAEIAGQRRFAARMHLELAVDALDVAGHGVESHGG
jgi:DNA-binding NarL/FixJ family response regulator